ncbi:MAG TPA: lipoyl(octanoyl) transferase LipB [Candidatus Nitrosotenuis sp.]|jgi:lipoyl(octanoyl) transferase|nr:lipoyl(octanoyl) transferase LipB [Candidatus Nitrosotenuis sp.]
MEWRIDHTPISYPEAVAFMEQRVRDIQGKQKEECVWLLEHLPLYTAGTSAKPEDLLKDDFPVYQTGRGGQFTYHGPGQRIAYVMIDLARREKDIRKFVFGLEQWLIETIASFGIQGERRPGRVGIWVQTPQGEEKIAAIGVRVSKWVSFHGVALNVNPDLTHFQGIVPCGLPQFGVSSLAQLGVSVTMAEVDEVMQRCWLNNKFLAVTDELPSCHADEGYPR